MPSSQRALLTPEERRLRWAELEVQCYCWGFTILLGVGVVGGAAGCVYWIALEYTLAYAPGNAFELASCAVINVTHQLVTSPPPCADIFTYTFMLASSPVVYLENEIRQRSDAGCFLPLDISAADGTLKLGSNKCFRLSAIYSQFAGVFSCVEGSELNHGRKSCVTLFDPKSTYDTGFNLAGAGMIFGVLVGVIFTTAVYICVSLYHADY